MLYIVRTKVCKKVFCSIISSVLIILFSSTFSENWSIRGGTVFSAYTGIAFNDSNLFKNNQGVALNVSG